MPIHNDSAPVHGLQSMPKSNYFVFHETLFSSLDIPLIMTYVRH